MSNFTTTFDTSKLNEQQLTNALRFNVEISNHLLTTGDGKNVLKLAVRQLREIFSVESCVIYLTTADNPKHNSLSLASLAQYPEIKNSSVQTVLSVGSRLKGGLTGHLANMGDLVRMSGKEIYESRYHTGRVASFLPSGECFSMMFVPLLGRKRRLLGCWKVENKQCDGNPPSRDLLFDESDEQLAKLLNPTLSNLVRSTSKADRVHKLLESMHTASQLKDIQTTVLETTIALVGADRAEIALWSRPKNRLVISGYVGDAPKSPKWAEVAEPSIMRSLWKNVSRDGRLVEDVRDAADYHCVHDMTRSQIVARIVAGETPMGVLSAESYDHSGFDEIDLDELVQFAKAAGIALQAVGAKANVGGAEKNSFRQTQPDETVLQSIIRSVLDLYRAFAGMIYLVDRASAAIVCRAYLDQDGRTTPRDEQEFRFTNGQRSAANYVWEHRKTYFSPTPHADPIFCSKGLKRLDVKGAWIGVPLIYGEHVVGVLGVWGDQDSYKLADISLQISPFGHLAAAYIAQSSFGVMRSVRPVPEPVVARNAPPGLATSLLTNTNLRLIHLGILAAGLERARIFVFDKSKQCLRHVISLGMKEEPNADEEVRSHYTQHIRETYQLNPTAWKCDPTDPTLFGEDPYRLQYDKDAELPWIIAPLIVGSSLYGQIAADNAISRKAITRPTLEYVTLLASLVSRQIEHSLQQQRMLATTQSEQLYHSLIDRITNAAIFRKDLKGRFIWGNDSFCMLLGRTWKEIEGKSDVDFFPEARAIAYMANDREAISKGKREFIFEEFVSPDTGEIRHLHVSKSAVYDSDGNVVAVQGICWDVTKEWEYRESLEELVTERTARLEAANRELHHRVKNNISRACGIVDLRKRRVDDPMLKHILTDLKYRLEAMALAHEHLYQTDGESTVIAMEYISGIIEHANEAYKTEHNIGFDVKVQDVPMSLTTAIPCGLIIHELVLNAIKYAFDSQKTPKICVTFHSVDDDVIIRVSDNGNGGGDGKNECGLGTNLVNAWVKQLDGNVYRHCERGTVVHIVFPVGQLKKAGDD